MTPRARRQPDRLAELQELRRQLVWIHNQLVVIEPDDSPTVMKAERAIRKAVGALSERRLELGYDGNQ